MEEVIVHGGAKDSREACKGPYRPITLWTQPVEVIIDPVYLLLYYFITKRVQ
jgi:hypothetical protein